jgi:hypothetical protein
MKIIFSYINISFRPSLSIKLAKISNYLAKKHGYTTELYADKYHYEKLKNIPYDNIIIIENKELERLPLNVWSAGKILTFSKINEPFLHLDMDVFLIKNYLEKFLNQNLIFFHSEPWISEQHWKNKFPNICNHMSNISEFNNLDYKSFNCAITGGANFKSINNSANIVLNYLIHNKDYIQKNTDHSKVNAAMFFEQVVFTGLCREYCKKPSLVLKNNYDISSKQQFLTISDLSKSKDFFALNCSLSELSDYLNCIYHDMLDKQLLHLWGNKKFIIETLNF